MNYGRRGSKQYGVRRHHRKRLRYKGGLLPILVLVCIIAVAAVGIRLALSGKSDVSDSNPTNAEPAKEYNVPPASEENDLLKIATSAAGTSDKVCYLTFDDGPTKEGTPQVLDVLKKYDVKATFFALGKMLDANREIAEREHNEGHLIANHSYSHDYNALYASSDSFISEIKKTQDVIDNINGSESFKLIRFPGGSYNAGDHAAEKQTYKEVLKQNGFYYADWNCLNGDAESSLKSADSLLNRVKDTATGKKIVVLMHDAATTTTTPEALGSIIEYLQSQGYKFKRLDEVEFYDDGKPDYDTSSVVL